jgi:hypothetical protein
MSDTVNLVAVRQLAGPILAVALEPPAWTRVEPQSVSGDPTPGLEARVADPCWLLLRQWQFGEFEGEDAGTPLGVHISYETRRLDGWQPGDFDPGAGALPLAPGDPLEPLVEREPPTPGGLGLRERAEAGAVLVSAMREAGSGDLRAALLAKCPLPLDQPPPAGVAPEQWVIPPALRLVARASPDAEAAAVSLEEAGAGAPDWLAGADQDAFDAAHRWLQWYRGQVAPPAAHPNPAWISERLEYRFSVRAGGDDPVLLRAPLHDGGEIDWYSFDCEEGRALDLPRGAEARSPGAVDVLATPLRYAGMPADRLWEFEDGAVNLGLLEVQPHDLARLCLTEFAMIYGNDWFVTPLDLPTASLTTLTEVAYITTFGDRFVVPVADDGARSGRFRMFQLSRSGTDAALPALLVPPSARGMLQGRALEDVILLRDESANMAWAIEKAVQGADGGPRNRSDEPLIIPELPPRKPGTELRYTLETRVPPNWIPLVPVPTTGQGGFVLRKGTMTERDQSLGVLLHPTPLTLMDEEVPREGVRVRRVPALLRTSDGRMMRWIARRVSVGRGEGSSGLAFDEATPAG